MQESKYTTALGNRWSGLRGWCSTVALFEEQEEIEDFCHQCIGCLLNFSDQVLFVGNGLDLGRFLDNGLRPE